MTKVKADAVSVDRLIVNEAAASSAQKGYAISGNVGAASFKDSNGAWPNTNEDYKTIVEKLKKNAYGYITAKADNTIERSEGSVSYTHLLNRAAMEATKATELLSIRTTTKVITKTWSIPETSRQKKQRSRTLWRRFQRPETTLV